MSNKSTSKLIKFYKGICLEQIYERMVELGSKLTIKEVDQEIKDSAGFTFDSCANENVTLEDMQNLITWAFVYGDAIEVYVDYPDSSEENKEHKLDLNFNRTEE